MTVALSIALLRDIAADRGGHTEDCWRGPFERATRSLGWWTTPAELTATTKRRLQHRQEPCTCGLVVQDGGSLPPADDREETDRV
jgi:hypothetical protein